jgi:hypothetical protein
LFWHATASGKRRRMSPGRRQWKKTAPTHLFAIALDPRGLPVGLFTVNRWVTDGFWFDAATTMSMVRRFRVATAEGHGDSSRWLTGFVQLYGPLIANLLEERDRRIARRPDLPSALEDRRLDLLSYLPIDWSADLDALESEVARRACLPGRAPFSEDISGERRCASQDWL